jgi:hypothetical protein
VLLTTTENIVANRVLSIALRRQQKKKKKKKKNHNNEKFLFFFFYERRYEAQPRWTNAAVARAAADCANAEVDDAGRIAERDTKRLKRNIVDAFASFFLRQQRRLAAKVARRMENFAKPG